MKTVIKFEVLTDGTGIGVDIKSYAQEVVTTEHVVIAMAEAFHDSDPVIRSIFNAALGLAEKDIKVIKELKSRHNMSDSIDDTND